MSSTQNIRRFQANPVEVAIFSVVALIFGNSVYNLFYGPQEFNPLALSQMHANPISEGRSPSSTILLNQTVNISCEKPIEEFTHASKIRLIGALCGAEKPENAGSEGGLENRKPPRLVITNMTNQFSAQVFADVVSGKFSTDYIPLNTGKNTIHLEFSYANGKPVSQDIVVNKNSPIPSAVESASTAPAPAAAIPPI